MGRLVQMLLQLAQGFRHRAVAALLLQALEAGHDAVADQRLLFADDGQLPVLLLIPLYEAEAPV